VLTPAGSGAIGAACEVTVTAAKTNPATAIAKIVRIIAFLLGENRSPPRHHAKNMAVPRQ
jgi:hypothetical protein